MKMTAKQYLAKAKEANKLRCTVVQIETQLEIAATALRATVLFERRESGTVILTKNAGKKNQVRATFTPKRRDGRGYSVKVNGVVVDSEYCGNINEYRLAMALGRV